MPAQTLCKNLTQTSIEGIIDKTPGASEQIEIAAEGKSLLVKCKSNDGGGTANDAIQFVGVIQQVADAESKIVHDEAKKAAAEEAKIAAAEKAKAAAAAAAKPEVPSA